MLFVLFSACQKEENKIPSCSGEQVFYGLYVTNYYGIQSNTGVIIGDVQKLAGYVQGNDSTWSDYFTELRLTNICNTHEPIIEFQVLLNASDPIPVTSAYIEEVGNPVRKDFLFSRDTSISYQFQTTSGFTPGILNMHFDFKFPFQGSTSADSAYFFSNLHQMKTTIYTIKMNL